MPQNDGGLAVIFRAYTTIDRASLGWPSGVWDDEPDKVQWRDEATGMPCLAVRQQRFGHWCGYVGIAPDHALYGEAHYKLDLEVHGGLTFANTCRQSESEETGVCHVPSEGEPDRVWWFGFDCAHTFLDKGPKDFARKPMHERGTCQVNADASYKTLDYVMAQCAALARQLATMHSSYST